MRVSVQPKEASFTIGLNPPDFDTVVSFDLAGRLIGLYVRETDETETNYRRGLDNRLVKLVKDASLRNRLIVEIARTERDELFERCFRIVRDALADGSLDGASRDLIARAAANGPEALERQAAKFRGIYGNVPILPPDQYRSLVLQVTRGCPFNNCKFCSFYRGCEFHVLTAEEFDAHMAAVRGFFGESMRLRTSVFLGDANAVLVPTETLLARMGQVRRQFNVAPAGLSVRDEVAWRREHPRGLAGFHGFLDGLSGSRKTVADYRRLADAGLRRVYIGAESGCDELLERLGKPSRRDDVIETVESCKKAGVAVGLIFLAGICEEDASLAAEHRRATCELAARLPLDADDIIYLSPYVARQAATPALPPDVEAELAHLEAAIGRRAGGPRVVTYDIRGFIY